MKDNRFEMRENAERTDENTRSEAIPLFAGVELSYLSFETDPFSMRHRHGAMEHMMQINYCKSGQMEWEMKNGSRIFLNPGDFSLHTMDLCTDSVVVFPTGQYSGLTICLDLRETAANPPELLKETDFLSQTLQKKFCRNKTVSFLAGNERTEQIFSGFYGQTEDCQLPYQRIKTLELLLYLHKLDFSRQHQLTAYQSEQIETIREIHNRLIRKIGERITIDELSKEYLINPTTLKTAFKAVYGASIAAHIKEHRMKKAAEMLRESDRSIAEIAQAVGYDSQSKFTAAFKMFFRVLPKEYKKKFQKTVPDPCLPPPAPAPDA